MISLLCKVALGFGISILLFETCAPYRLVSKLLGQSTEVSAAVDQKDSVYLQCQVLGFKRSPEFEQCSVKIWGFNPCPNEKF